jgi:hypothetical protein
MSDIPPSKRQHRPPPVIVVKQSPRPVTNPETNSPEPVRNSLGASSLGGDQPRSRANSLTPGGSPRQFRKSPPGSPGSRPRTPVQVHNNAGETQDGPGGRSPNFSDFPNWSPTTSQGQAYTEIIERSPNLRPRSRNPSISSYVSTVLLSPQTEAPPFSKDTAEEMIDGPASSHSEEK